MTLQYDRTIQDGGDIPAGIASIAHAYARLFLERLGAAEEGARPEGYSWHELWDHIMETATGDGKAAVRPNAEETAAALIRSGVPSTAVRATYQNVTVTLPCGKYRIYREPSGFGGGAFRILSPGDSGILHPGITSEALAELILSLEDAMPSILEAVERMREGLRKAETRRTARMKAEQIEQTTVRRLLEETLVPMDIDCGFEVVDGVVRLSLSRTLTGRVEIPLEQLGAFLSDAARVESALTPEKAEQPAAFVKGSGRRHIPGLASLGRTF
jgi:hypothetical protein